MYDISRVIELRVCACVCVTILRVSVCDNARYMTTSVRVCVCLTKLCVTELCVYVCVSAFLTCSALVGRS